MFVRLLMILVHWSAGEPARGTELVGLKYVNSGDSRRNFYIIHERVVMVTAEGGKTEGMADVPKVIARYLPIAVGKLYIAYVADVFPFRNLCDVAVSASTCCDRAVLDYHRLA